MTKIYVVRCYDWVGDIQGVFSIRRLAEQYIIDNGYSPSESDYFFIEVFELDNPEQNQGLRVRGWGPRA